MKRRDFLGALGAAGAAATAGCLTNSTNQSAASSTQRGGLIANLIDAPPTNATVIDATSGRAANSEPVQTVIDRVLTNDIDYALLHLDPQTFTDVQTTLDHFPRYTEPDAAPGYYLQHNEQTILLYPFFLNEETN